MIISGMLKDVRWEPALQIIFRIIGGMKFSYKIISFILVESNDLNGVTLKDRDLIGVEGTEVHEDSYNWTGRDRNTLGLDVVVLVGIGRADGILL